MFVIIIRSFALRAIDSGHYTHYTQEQGCISLSCLANIAASLACSRRLQRGSVAAL